MKNWIARLLKGEPRASAPGTPPVPTAGSAPAPAAPALDAQADGASLDQRFWDWLCEPPAGVDPAQAAGPAARLVLDELARLARAPGQAAELVPRVPEVIPRLLRSLRDEAVSSAELALE